MLLVLLAPCLAADLGTSLFHVLLASSDLCLAASLRVSVFSVLLVTSALFVAAGLEVSLLSTLLAVEALCLAAGLETSTFPVLLVLSALCAAARLGASPFTTPTPPADLCDGGLYISLFSFFLAVDLRAPSAGLGESGSLLFILAFEPGESDARGAAEPDCLLFSRLPLLSFLFTALGGCCNDLTLQDEWPDLGPLCAKPLWGASSALVLI